MSDLNTFLYNIVKYKTGVDVEEITNKICPCKKDVKWGRYYSKDEREAFKLGYIQALRDNKIIHS